MSIPQEVLKKVKLLEISTRKLVNNTFAGEYHTAFKGQGMTFADFREYVPGDDIRAISWTLTARAGKPFIKKYEEERELSVILAVDVSGSTDFGTGEYFKGEVIAHVAALLAFSAIRNKDQVGLLLFSDQIEHFVPPAKGRGQVNRILRDLLYFKPKSKKTNVSIALDYLQGVLKKRTAIFILSDFMDKGFDVSLRLLGRKHDVVSIIVQDKAENEIPKSGIVEVQDAESGDIILIDSEDEQVQLAFKKHQNNRRNLRDQLLRKSQVDRVEIPANGNYVDPLIQFFKTRHRK